MGAGDYQWVGHFISGVGFTVSLWGRACPRTPAKPVQSITLPASRARLLPQDSALIRKSS
ncbi:hypothetical protein METHP15_490026 [Pseudomonas sp. P15-2025]